MTISPCPVCRGTGLVAKTLAFGIFELGQDGDLATERCPSCKGSLSSSVSGAAAYDLWIQTYRKEKGWKMVGTCQSATQAMGEFFPELRRVPGRVLLGSGRECEHWWCESNRQVWDPTEPQFDEEGGIIDYIPWKPGDEVRIGKCMNCGVQIYAAVQKLGEPPVLPPGVSTMTCSAGCGEALAMEFNT